MKVGGNFASAEARGERSQQEDYHIVRRIEDADKGNPSDLLAILADGMGGHIGGERASRTAVTAFETGFLTGSGDVPERFAEALYTANRQLADDIAENAQLEGMGCTLVCAYVTSTRLFWISVGDSHLYIFREGQANKLNEDHSLGGHLRRQKVSGELDVLCTEDFPSSHILLSALTGQGIDLVDVSVNPMTVDAEDIILLASDGLNSLTRDELTDFLNSYVQSDPTQPLEVLVDTLLAAVKGKNIAQQDNVTLIALRPPVLQSP